MADWSFLTSHARVLLCIAHDPGVRLRDIAARTGVTEGIVTEPDGPQMRWAASCGGNWLLRSGRGRR